MKTTLRVLALGVGMSSLLLCIGCKEDEASAQGFDFANAGLAAEPTLLPLEPATSPAVEPAQPPATNVAPAAAVTTNANDTVSRESLAPEAIKLSVPLAEVIKMAQAGVGEDVLMAYITNSVGVFEIGSNEILYLHDLGMPAPVISALIQRDASPEIQARRQLASAVKPLPPGVGLTTPATNVYPTKIVAQPPEPTPVNPSQNEGTAAVPPPGPTVVEQPAVAQEPVTIAYFESSLAPYGSWVDVPGYGSCWRPTVAVCNSSWRPYADHGRWLWTDAGWYWYSDYSWGWAPFHYGRWACPQGIGWVWTPDTHWGPSWVSWRYSSSYCGWAPLPPSAVWGGHGFYHNTLSVGISFDFGLCDFDYVFLPVGRFCDRTPYHYYASSSHARTIYKDSTVVNNYVVGNNNTIINNGVGLDRVAKVTRGDIRQVALKDGNAVRDLGPRRERLETDGKTLTVVRPTLVNSRIESPLKPISATSGVKSHQSLGSGKDGVGPATSLAGTMESTAPLKAPAMGSRPTHVTTSAADKSGIMVPSKPGGTGIFKPTPTERSYGSISKPMDTANLGGAASTPPKSIIIKPTGSPAKPVNTVPSWMNVSPSASASVPVHKNPPAAVSAQAPQASAPAKSPSMAKSQPATAPVYSQPAATKTPSYRAPESPQPRLSAPSYSPAPAVRVQPAQGGPSRVTPSVSPTAPTRSQSAPASSGKSESASRSSSSSSSSRSSGESRGYSR